VPQLESSLVARQLEGVAGVDQRLVRELVAARRHPVSRAHRFAVIAFPPSALPPGFPIPFGVV
jgi:hypothetical protein